MFTPFKSIWAAAFAVLCVVFAAVLVFAQNNPNLTDQGNSSAPRNRSIGAQPGSPPSSPPGISGQGGDDTTLEIAPQRGVPPPSGTTDEIPGGREFKPGQSDASVDRNFKPGEQSNLNSKYGRGPNGGRNAETGGRACLGLNVQYNSYCFKGVEEHGLEVVSVDANGPAEKAGVKQQGNTTLETAAATASAFLGPLQMLTNPLLEKAARGQHGDMIVAVDDQRIRTKADLDDAMARLRPGDTMYLTVLRPIPGGSPDHRTLKIRVKVGKQTNYGCSEAPDTASSGLPPATE